MAELKPLPLIIRQRAERILNQRVAICYRVEESNPNLIKCIMVGMDRVYYVDLLTNKQVSALSIHVVADEAGKEDTEMLTGSPSPSIDFDVEIKDEGGIANELPPTDTKSIKRPKKVHTPPTEKTAETAKRVKKARK